MNIPIRRQPLNLPNDEPSTILIALIPFERSYSDILPSKKPTTASEMALPTRAPANAPVAPKSSAPRIA